MDQQLIDKIPELTDLILPWLGILISLVLSIPFFNWFILILSISKPTTLNFFENARAKGNPT